MMKWDQFWPRYVFKLDEIESSLEADQVIIGALKRQLNQTIDRIREISHNLTPASLSRFGLKYAVDDLISELRGSGIQVSFHTNYERNIISNFYEMNLYRIIQELLLNAIKHSGASQVAVDLQFVNEQVMLNYHDNGKGIEITEPASLQGIGMVNMQTRSRLLGGTMELVNPNQHGLHMAFDFIIPSL